MIPISAHRRTCGTEPLYVAFDFVILRKRSRTRSERLPTKDLCIFVKLPRAASLTCPRAQPKMCIQWTHSLRAK